MGWAGIGAENLTREDLWSEDESLVDFSAIFYQNIPKHCHVTDHFHIFTN